MVFSINLDPTTGKKLKMQLYEDVKNTAELRQKVLSGQIMCGLIRPELICDPLPIIIATNKALISKKLITKSIFTEILFNLSPSTNISQSLIKFGIDDKSRNVLMVTLVEKIDNNDEADSEDIFSIVDGNMLDISELGCTCDINAIRKIYKISDKETDDNDVSLLDSVVSRIAIKE